MVLRKGGGCGCSSPGFTGGCGCGKMFGGGNSKRDVKKRKVKALKERFNKISCIKGGNVYSVNQGYSSVSAPLAYTGQKGGETLAYSSDKITTIPPPLAYTKGGSNIPITTKLFKNYLGGGPGLTNGVVPNGLVPTAWTPDDRTWPGSGTNSQSGSGNYLLQNMYLRDPQTAMTSERQTGGRMTRQTRKNITGRRRRKRKGSGRRKRKGSGRGIQMGGAGSIWDDVVTLGRETAYRIGGDVNAVRGVPQIAPSPVPYIQPGLSSTILKVSSTI